MLKPNILTGKLEIANPSSGAWQPPSDWIDISIAADNEINLLVTEGAGIGFRIKVGTGTGTFSIDWGDGVVESGLVGNNSTVFKHKHLINGTPCSQGYNTWKVRIFGASGNIAMWKVARHNYIYLAEYQPILWAVFGTRFITDYSNAFYSTEGNMVKCTKLQKCVIPDLTSCLVTSYMFQYCLSLVSVILPESWGAVRNTSFMFSACTTLETIKLPASWGLVTTTEAMFISCDKFKFTTIPETWGLITSCASMFQYCRTLSSIKLPNNWGSVINASVMFDSCYLLTYITFPDNYGNITNAQMMLSNCYSLIKAQNHEFIGSLTTACSLYDFIYNSETINQNIIIGSLIREIQIRGISVAKLKINSIRLTNPGSTFTGGSPQVNVSYTDLSPAALVALFGDLPALASKTINITGCTGSAALTAPERAIATAKGWTIIG